MLDHLMVRENWLTWMYLAFAFMVAVPAGLAWYYHTRVRRYTTGRALKNAQRLRAPQHGNVAGNLVNGLAMWREIQAGRYGAGPRRLINHCAAGFLAWAVVLVVWFGLLLYAEERVKARGGWPETHAPAAEAQASVR